VLILDGNQYFTLPEPIAMPTTQPTPLPGLYSRLT
jgi:hypothetical protein